MGKRKVKRLLTVIFVIVLLLQIFTLSGCSSDKDYSKSQTEAYYLIFEWLTGNLDKNTEYIAVDLSGVMLKDTKPLIKRMQKYCNRNNYTLLLNTYDELAKKGYIDRDRIYFPKGVLLRYKDSVLEKNMLITEASSFSGGLSAFGAEITVKKVNGKWVMPEKILPWIS